MIIYVENVPDDFEDVQSYKDFMYRWLKLEKATYFTLLVNRKNISGTAIGYEATIENTKRFI